jgi:hypothetical protein
LQDFYFITKDKADSAEIELCITTLKWLLEPLQLVFVVKFDVNFFCVSVELIWFTVGFWVGLSLKVPPRATIQLVLIYFVNQIKSANTIAAIASTIGTARGTTHGWRPFPVISVIFP